MNDKKIEEIIALLGKIPHPKLDQCPECSGYRIAYEECHEYLREALLSGKLVVPMTVEDLVLILDDYQIFGKNMPKPSTKHNAPQRRGVDMDTALKKIKDEAKRYFKRAKWLTNCPICESVYIYPVREHMLGTYGECSICKHVFVMNINKAVNIYKNYHEQYMKDEERHLLVARRKISRVFEITQGSIIDIGAGCGHFGKICKDLGIDYTGIEISEQARRYAKKRYGITLLKTVPKRTYTVATYWGVIEHLINPYEFKDLVDAKYSFFEMPRWESASTIVQLASGKAVRHLVPQRHLHMFTDTSLCNFVKRLQKQIVKVWYFGKDIEEIKAQTGIKLPEEMQTYFDNSRLCDFMTVAVA